MSSKYYSIANTQNRTEFVRKLLTDGFDEQNQQIYFRPDPYDTLFQSRVRGGRVGIRIHDEANPNRQGGLIVSRKRNFYLAHAGNFSGVKAGFRPFYLGKTSLKKIKVLQNEASIEIVLIAGLENKHTFYQGLYRFFEDVLDTKAIYDEDADGVTEREAMAIIQIQNDPSLTEAQRRGILKSRRGQGKFREDVLEQSNCCIFTAIDEGVVLTASHIKRWVDSNNQERLDPYNGLTLSATYDRLFDKHFISFDSKGCLLVSSRISPQLRKKLILKPGKSYFSDKKMRLREEYFAHHRRKLAK